MGTGQSTFWNQCPLTTNTPKDLRRYISVMQTKCSTIIPNRKFRIVMCSPSNHGKSSSINNILAALEGTYGQTANVRDHPEHGAEKYIEYMMLIDDSAMSPFLMCETPGLRNDISKDDEEVQTEAIKSAIIGKFKSGQELNYMKLTLQQLEQMEIRDECAICVIFVIDVRTVKPDMTRTSNAFQSIRNILDFVQRKDLKVACFLTNCDKFNNKVKEDLKHMYKSQTIQNARELLARQFTGLPINRIFPIVNYAEKLQVDDDMMVQSLFALNHIMGDITSYFRKRVDVPSNLH
ncbi:hypothetical protein CHS0354_037853 [Potamilus streckersoni]|uniref:G domain-containing protein n=1 Tax=Potamilus streckersoni TaxID=2493646 RepID=A0AAE0SYJ5_9BIVA|nr:hypothetical protein CHS0354_037853 [Potamilus streckersoni]